MFPCLNSDLYSRFAGIPSSFQRDERPDAKGRPVQTSTLSWNQALHQTRDASDCLAAIANLNDEDRNTITNTIDALTTRQQLRTITN